MRISRISIVVMTLAIGLALAAFTPSAGQTTSQAGQHAAPQLVAAEQLRQAARAAQRAAVDRAAAERAALQAAADRVAADRIAAAGRAAAEALAQQAATDRAAAEAAARQAATDRAAAEVAARQAAADRAAAQAAASQAAADRAAAEETARRAATERAAAEEAARRAAGNGVVENNMQPGEEKAPGKANHFEPPPAVNWLVPLLIGAGAMLALVVTGFMLKRVLWPKPTPEPAAGDAQPPPPATAVIRPSIDPLEGAVSGDEIALAGPEIRLRGVLEPGETRFDGGEPVIEGESRDG